MAGIGHRGFMGRKKGACFSWTPSEIIGDINLWLDSSDPSNYTLVSGKVSQWADISGNSRHATQTNASLRPNIQSSGINGIDTILFDSASTETMDLPSIGISSNDNRSFFMVLIASNNGGGFSQNWLNTNFGGNSRFTARRNSFSARIEFSGSGDGTGSILLANPFIVSGRYEPNTFNIYADGNIDATPLTTSLNTIDADNRLGVYSALAGGGNPQYFSGQMAEIIYLNTKLDDDGMDLMHAYLAKKWGLNNNLPDTNPYKAIPAC